jgi:hypothetical protein
MVLQINAMERWLCFLGGEWWIAERERERERERESQRSISLQTRGYLSTLIIG